MAGIYAAGAGRGRQREWPAGTTDAMRGGAPVWNTPALDPELGLLYFATGNCGPDYDGSMREGDNLFCASIMAVDAKTGAYRWHFQEVHHDIWDYDAASPVVLFDTVINGQPRKGLAEAGRTGWVYILDRTNGKPLVGIEEKPVPQEPRQKTAKTQPIPIGDATVPQCAQPLPGYDVAGCIYSAFWDTPVLVQPGGQGGTNWSPMPYDPEPVSSTSWYDPGEHLRPLRQPVEERPALCGWHSVGPDRFTAGRHIHRDQRHHQQDRLAAADAISHGRGRRFDGHRRRPVAAR